MPNESLHHDYGRLTRFLKGISLRLQLVTALEFLLLLASNLILILLGSLFVLDFQKTLPYFPFFYYLLAILSLLFLLILGLWRVAF